MNTGSTHREGSSLIGKTGIFFLMLSIIVLFGTLTLAFILTPEKIDKPFYVPGVFYFNTVLLILSSILLHYSYRRSESIGTSQFISYCLWIGLFFLIGQVWGWYELFTAGNIPGTQNPKMDYLYVLSGVHGAHLAGAMIFLLVVRNAVRNNRFNLLEIAVYFWHFLGILWIYLLIVLTFNS